MNPTQQLPKSRNQHASAEVVDRALPQPRRVGLAQLGHFFGHFAAMILAMLVGMAIFGGLRAALGSTGYAALLNNRLDISLVLMSLFMATSMAGWMRFRGHSWERIAEMDGGMAGPVVVLCVLWHVGAGTVLPVLSTNALPVTVHVAMLLGMLIAMLYRFSDYAQVMPHRGVYRLSPGN